MSEQDSTCAHPPLEVPDEIRFKILKRLLRIRDCEAVGILKMLQEYSKERGAVQDLSRLKFSDVAEYLEWPTDGQDLLVALIRSKWLVPNGAALILHHRGRPSHIYRASKPSRAMDVTAREWLELRSLVIARDGLICNYCGVEVDSPHIDHVIPMARGGKSILENLTVACLRCNSSKGSKTPEEWWGRQDG